MLNVCTCPPHPCTTLDHHPFCLHQFTKGQSPHSLILSKKLSRKNMNKKFSPILLNNKLLYRVTYVCLLNDCLFMC